MACEHVSIRIGGDEICRWQKELQTSYPQLAAIRQADWIRCIDRAQKVEVPAETEFLREGDSSDTFALLLQGEVRVYQLAKDGRAVTLYRLQPGDICALNLRSLIQNRPFDAFAVAETEVSALLLSADDFRHAMGASQTFRDFVFSSLSEQFFQVAELVRDTVFNRLDMRLACLLGRLFERSQSEILRVTHQELANELGTSREVISRILKEFERQQCIALSRGQIQLRSAEGLAWFTDHAGP